MRPLFLLSTLILSSSIAFAQVDAPKAEASVTEKAGVEAIEEKVQTPTEPRQIRAQARIHKEECATGDCPGKAQNEKRNGDKAEKKEQRKEMKNADGKREAQKEKRAKSKEGKKHHSDKGNKKEHHKKEKRTKEHRDGSMKGDKGAKKMEGRN